MKTKYYVDGRTTVCLLIDNGTVVARGLSICSRAEDREVHIDCDCGRTLGLQGPYYGFDPAKGRKQAYARAMEAYGRKANCHPILLDSRRGSWADTLTLSLAKDRFGDCKGYYLPTLTPTEQLLVK